MRQLPLSGSVTFALSARMALDAHGIRWVMPDPFAGGVPAHATCILIDDDDFERARKILADLQDTSPTPSREEYDAPTFRIFVNAAVSGMFIWLLLALRH